MPVDRTDPDHERVVAKIRRGDLTGSSFAFEVEDELWFSEGRREVREIRSVRLYDVGPVSFAAYAAATTGM